MILEETQKSRLVVIGQKFRLFPEAYPEKILEQDKDREYVLRWV